MFNLVDFGYLTEQDGSLASDEHGNRIPVATHVVTGKRWRRICEMVPGKGPEHVRECKRLTDAGAVHLPHEQSSLRGWWMPVAEGEPIAPAGPAA